MKEKYIKFTYKILKLILFIISMVLFLIGNIIKSLNLQLIGVTLFCFFNIFSSFKDIKTNINFCVFNIVFYTMLLGRYFSQMLSNVNYSRNIDYNIINNTMILLFISLISLYIGKEIFEKLYSKYFSKRQDSKKTYVEQKNIYVRNISRLMFFITLAISIIIALEKVIFVKKNSYLALYTDFNTQIPTIICKIGETNLLFLLIYLFTFPKKKETLITISTYFIYLVISIFTGSRGEFVTKTILIFIYFIYRQDYISKEKYFTKKTIGIAFILATCAIILLSSYNVWRNGKKIENFNLFKQFNQFFIDQGGTVELLNYTQIYKDELPNTNVNYTFGPFITYIKYGTISKILNMGQQYYRYNTEEMALYGNNLGQTLSYLVMKDNYINGHGLGTSYIAELYTDYSHIGVILYNLILGYILIYFTKLNKKNWIVMAYSFNILSQIIYLPRQSAMTWVVNLFSIPNLFTIFIVYIYAEFMYRKCEVKKIEESTLDS